MIVADSNLVAYLLIPGKKNINAEHVLRKDPEWSAPILWRSEMRNILALYMREQGMTLKQAHITMLNAEKVMDGREYVLPSDTVLEWAEKCGVSAYDAEFIALADALGVTLVTADKKIAKAAPRLAVLLDKFIS